jgi:hypothetical protein
MKKNFSYLIKKACEWQKWTVNLYLELLKKYWIGIILGLFVMIGLDYVYGSVCFSIIMFGIPCPGCGMTRATKLLLTGHLKQSFQMHPLLPLVIIGVVFYPIIKKILKNYILFVKIYVIICLVIFIGFYIYRMKMYYPNIQPMIYYKDNYLYKVALFLQNWRLIK